MMKESMSSRVIQDILSVEDRAAALEASAKKQAEEILSQAEVDAAGIIRSALDKEKAQGRAQLAAAQVLLQEEMNKNEDPSASESPDVSLSAEVVDSIAEEIVALVLSSKLFADKADRMETL